MSKPSGRPWSLWILRECGKFTLLFGFLVSVLRLLLLNLYRRYKLLIYKYLHHQCTSGVCKDGKCASVECPVDPDVFTPRRCGERCACFSTQAGGAFCAFDQECAGLTDCEEDSDCPTGALCASRNACPDQFLNCCTRKVCLNRCEDGYLEAKQVPDAFNISEFSGALASGQNAFYPYSYGWWFGLSSVLCPFEMMEDWEKDVEVGLNRHGRTQK